LKSLFSSSIAILSKIKCSLKFYVSFDSSAQLKYFQIQ